MFINMYESSNYVEVLEAICFPTVEIAREMANNNSSMYLFTLFKKRNGEWIELDLSKPTEKNHEKTISTNPNDDLPF